MGGDLCGVVEKKRRREGDGWRVRASTEDAQGEKTSSWGGLALWLRSARRRDGGSTRLQRMAAAAGNLRSACRDGMGPARETAICFEMAQYQGAARERGNLRRKRVYCAGECSRAGPALVLAAQLLALTAVHTTDRTLRLKLPVSWCVWMCVSCTPAQRNLSTSARSQQTDLDGTMAPLGFAPATPPGPCRA
jgi:hypothetical protein